MMRYLIVTLVLVLVGLNLKGQTLSEPEEGSISYITTQNIYVNFRSTENIAVGDTLFIKQNDQLIPVLKVTNLSSISCVCLPIGDRQFLVSDKVYSKQKPKKTEAPVKTGESQSTVTIPPDVKKDTVATEKPLPKKPKQVISGRASVSSYANFSNTTADNSLRMRYTLTLNAKNLGNSKLSAESYISFVHKNKEWSEIKSNIFNGLKIYSLAFKYDFNANTNLWFGRKINPKLSNVGAIDGLQFEKKHKSISYGIVAGTRPDYIDYSFNAKLFQFGGYFAHDYATKNGNMQNSMAIIEQEYNGKTDRRFAYFQHSNMLIKNLYLFGSIEFDLYKKVLNKVDSTFSQDNSPSLSNVYFSVRYKINRQVSVSGSYSARQNIIYYETFATNIIERLLESSALQGYNFQLNYHPLKSVSLGARAGYRSRKEDPAPSKNLYGYITFSRVPVINAMATLSATWMETGYLSGKIYSVGLNRDIISGKLSGGLSYKYVDYKFTTYESKLVQNMGEIDLTWKIYIKLYGSLNYEGTFEKSTTYNRIYFNLTQRF